MKSNMKSFWGKLPARWRQHQVHTICWACFVFRSIRVKKLNWSKPREQWAVLCQQQHFLFQSCQPSSPWSLFLTWPHTHYFFLPLLILVFWTFFFLFCGLAWGGVGILNSSWSSEEPRKGGTQRADVLFHHTRSLCGCQLAAGALGMVCMCWASGVARHTSGKGWGSQRRAWNSKVKQSDTLFMKGKLPPTFLLCGLSMFMNYCCVDFVSWSYL